MRSGAGAAVAVTGLLEGKVVAVTGAASGIGLATARLAAREGAAGLLLADRDETALASAVADVEAAAGGAVVVGLTVDVTADDVSEEIVDRAVRLGGRLDAAVNCAGVEGGTLPLHECGDADFDSVMAVNVTGVFRCMRAQLRQMYRQSAGSVVNVASASVFGVHADLGPYTASKSAVLTLSRVAAKEAGPRGVRVNAVCPGLTDTPMLARSFGERAATADIAARIPLGRVGAPGEQAEAVAWLCSDRSSFVNGAALVADGGRTG